MLLYKRCTRSSRSLPVTEVEAKEMPFDSKTWRMSAIDQSSIGAAGFDSGVCMAQTGERIPAGVPFRSVIGCSVGLRMGQANRPEDVSTKGRPTTKPDMGNESPSITAGTSVKLMQSAVARILTSNRAGISMADTVYTAGNCSGEESGTVVRPS